MTEEYRCKLRYWLTSMLVLHLFAMLWACLFWNRLLKRLQYYDHDVWQLIGDLTWFVSETYILIFVVLAVWHFFDLIQAGKSKRRYWRLFGEYRWLIGLFCFYGFAQIFIMTPYLDDLGCPENQFGFDGCGSFTPWWKALLAFIPLLAMCLLALGKAMSAIYSWITRFNAAVR